MCCFNCVYHDSNVRYYERPMLNKKKLEVATIFTDVTDFDNEQKCTSASKHKATINVHF